MGSSADVRHFFNNVQKKLENTAQRKLTAQLPTIMQMIRDYALNHERAARFGNMTGNWLNSFGVALYRDGRPVALANMPKAGVNAPIRTTLITGDWFKRGQKRYDNTYQRRTFEIDGSKYQGAAEQVFYNEEVMDWLARTWTQKKGFSLRAVSVTEYEKDTARRVLLQLSDELEDRGGRIFQFNLG